MPLTRHYDKTKFTHYFSKSYEVPSCIEMKCIGHQINCPRLLVWKEVEGKCHIKKKKYIS